MSYRTFVNIKTTEGGNAMNWGELVHLTQTPNVIAMTRSVFEGLSDDERAEVKRGQSNIILSAASRRLKEDIEEEGLTAIGLDFDSGEITLDQVINVLSDLGITQYVTYSTISHSQGRPRFRAILPLEGALSVAEWQTLADYLHDVIFPTADKSGKKASQAWFLPASFEDDDTYEYKAADGDPLSVAHDSPVYAAAAAYQQSLANFRDKKKAHERGLLDSPITYFNQHVPLENCLLDYGYKKVGSKRYIHPKSQSGLAGVTILGEGNHSYSHHDCDPLKGRVVDAFELYAHFEHGGDKAKAASAIKALMPKGHTTHESPDERGRNPLRYTRGSQGLNLDLKWLIKGLIGRGIFGYIYGPSASFKSFVALDMCFAIVRGEPWHGHKTEKGAVLYIAAEGRAAVEKRIRARELVDDRLYNEIFIPEEPIIMNNPLDAQRIVDTLKDIEAQEGVKVSLVVVDTLARTFDGDENKNNEISSFVRGCDYIIQQTGATVVAVHHSGKDKTRGARGASALKAAVDTEIEIDREPPSEIVKVTNKKQKDAEELEPFSLRLREVPLDINDEDGDPITSLIVDRVAVTGPLRNARDDKKAEEMRWIVDQAEAHPSIERLALRRRFVEEFADERKPDSRRTAFDKHLKSLLECERLDLESDKLYPVTDD
ncbi:AAA family ATPase [Enterovibrio coralii]|uniref:Uncharacterized protein n=1 Tax=Enterovibrio coralii TaxID=294935 RepID=A0A135I2V1_9GAMM|nr:AAA family ATPase [Enterovibrio coralii]KXF79744.1 hypothetical protein ATN88_12550 [Enterovibrio coralii]